MIRFFLITRLIGSVPCYNIYKTKEGYISVGCLEPHFWKGFVVGIGLPKYAPIHFAFANGKQCEQIKQKIEENLAQKTAQEWEDFFIADNRGRDKLPVIALRYAEQSLKNDELLDLRNMKTEYTAEGGQTIKLVHPGLDYASFLKMKHSSAIGAPKLGEHNDMFLKLQPIPSKL